MRYRVELSVRANRDLENLFHRTDAVHSSQAALWFNGLEAAICSFQEHPARCPLIARHGNVRQLLYRSKSQVYRIIYAIGEEKNVANVLTIRHGARNPLGDPP